LFQHFKKVMASVDQVSTVSLSQLTNKMFYKDYLTNSFPLLVEDGCQLWPALKKWTMPYLSEEFGTQSVQISMINKVRGIHESFGKRETFLTFWNKTENETQHGVRAFYIKNEMIVNKNLQKDIIKPEFLAKILRNRLTALTMWT